MKEQTWQIEQVGHLISKNLAVLILSVLFFAGLAVLTVFYLPSSYRSQAMLSIQSSYFQNPLVKDLIAEEVDPDELRSQRFALLRMALTPQFIDQLGDKYKIYQYPPGHFKRSSEREQLMQRIEYFPDGPTIATSGAFQLRVTAPSGPAAYGITREVLERMLETLFEQRQKKLTNTRQSIEKQLTLLGQFLKESSSDAGSPVARGPEALNTELRRVQAELAALLRHYTARHPTVIKKQQQLDALTKQVERFGASVRGEDASVGTASTVLSAGAAQARLQEVYNDLITKLSNLDVVISIEGSEGGFSHLSVIEQPTVPLKPVFPSKRIFALLGAMLGLSFGVLVALLRELKGAALVAPSHIPEQLGLPLLGELPTFKPIEGLLMLDHQSHNGNSKPLPLLKKIGEAWR